MRFLADEGFPGDAVAALRNAGHDVAWVAERNPGSLDSQVLETANRENRVLLTLDKDFGELVFRRGASASPGVILFRIALLSPAAVAKEVVAVISSRTGWAGHFSVVEPGLLRMRQLPP